MKLAFFDSGIGGLSVLHHAMKILPHEEFIFFADENNVPYGTKSPAEVLRYVDAAFEFLTAQKVSAIVVACNTATSVAVKQMREKYPLPIIGMEPALKVALDLFPRRKVLVTATAITITGEKIRWLINRLNAENFAELRALSRLVEFAERQEFTSSAVENYLRGELAPYDWENFSSLVLGCTHFNYFKDTFRKILPPHVKILDGNAGTVNELIRRTNLQMTQEISAAERFRQRHELNQQDATSRCPSHVKILDGNAGTVNELIRRTNLQMTQEISAAEKFRQCHELNQQDATSRCPPHVKILDGNTGTVNEPIRRVKGVGCQGSGVSGIEFFYSGRLVTDAAELARLEKFLRRLDDMEALT